MIKLIPIIFLILTLSPQNAYAQGDMPNDFRIGIFRFYYTMDNEKRNMPISSPFLPGTDYPSSELNVYIKNGVNTIQDYRIPSPWFHEDKVTGILNLLNNLNEYYGSEIKLMTNSKTYFMPLNNDSGGGENVYNNISSDGETGSGKHAYNSFKPRPHYDNLINTIYSSPAYQHLIWGHQVSEEAAYYHPFYSTMDLPNKDNLIYVEVPPGNVGSALAYFKESLAAKSVYNQKFILMEGYHGRAVLPGATETQGIYYAPDYLPLLDKNDPRDVWFEGSYNRWEGSKWFKQEYSNIFKPGNKNYHYLGKFESVDYAKKFTDNVQKVITVSLSRPKNGKITWDSITYYRYHANLNIKNANWLWFQVYTSIIHGVDGIWFWNVRDCWDRNDPGDVARNKMRVNNDPARYEEENFYDHYTNYLAPIIKEMRYLVNHNLLSTDETSILFAKTTQKDVNSILDDPKSYIFKGNHDGNWDLLNQTKDNHQSEVYGLRYTIRSNGTETIMIISNPLDVPIESVRLDFSRIRDSRIQDATGIHLLFKGKEKCRSYRYPRITNKNYKTVRKSNFDFDTPIDEVPYVNISRKYNFKKKELSLSFGPLDVHVIHFGVVSTSDQ